MSAVRRAVAAAAGLALLVGVGAMPGAQMTDAAFSDPEAAGGVFTAGAVPAPVSSRTPGCVMSSGLAGANPRITIYWRIPAGVVGYSSSDAQYVQIDGGVLGPLLDPLLGTVTTTGTATEYTTVINGALLSGILGGSKTFAIRLKGPGDWTSSWIVANASMGLAGLNPQCAMTTRPA